jgi:hypothetical protein
MKARALISLTIFIASFSLFPVSIAFAALYNASALLGEVDSHGNPIWTAGVLNNGSGSSNSVNAQGFAFPFSVSLDSINQRLFVEYDSNGRVLVFPLDSQNAIAATTPAFVLGQTDFTSRVGTTTQSGMQSNGGSPSILYDPSSERLFVADNDNSRILDTTWPTASPTE